MATPTAGQGIADAAAATAGLALGRYFANQGANSNVPPQLLALLDQSVQRQNAQNPLFGAVNSGAYQMLPTFARNGAGSFTPGSSAVGSYGSMPTQDGPSAGGTAALASLPLIMNILRHFNLIPAAPGAGVANLGPIGSAGNPGMSGKPPMANNGGGGIGGGGGGGSAAPGSNDYNALANLAQSGIGGMFYGGGFGGGGGGGYPGDQGAYGYNTHNPAKAF